MPGMWFTVTSDPVSSQKRQFTRADLPLPNRLRWSNSRLCALLGLLRRIRDCVLAGKRKRGESRMIKTHERDTGAPHGLFTEDSPRFDFPPPLWFPSGVSIDPASPPRKCLDFTVAVFPSIFYTIYREAPQK